jgi:hypothetical protein
MIRPTVIALALALALANPTAQAAAVGAIEGTVVDAQAQRTVPAGSVTASARCGAVARTGAVDPAGQFRVAGLPEGPCALTVRGPAYAATTMSVRVTAGSITTLVVNVSSLAYVAKLRAEQLARVRRDPIPASGVINVTGHLIGRKELDSPAPVAIVDRAALAAEPPRAVAPPRPPAAPQPAPRAVPPTGVRPAPPAATRPARLALAAPVAPTKRVALEAQNAAAAASKAGARAGGFAGPPAGALDRLDDARPKPLAKRALRRAGPQRDADAALATGWAPVRVFPVPQYSRGYDGPRSDFRETVYWNPAVETDAQGDAEVRFVTSDAVTAFRATAEGFSTRGIAGTGQIVFQSKLPLSLAAHLPVEASTGDTIQLPVTLTNETDQPLDAQLTAAFGAALKLTRNPISGAIHLAAHQARSAIFPLEVVAADGDAELAIKLTARGLSDELKRTIRIVPRGFPTELSASGTARAGTASRHSVDLAGALPGTIRATVTMYPSPVAAMTQGMEGMIREPGGCFEQTSSTNYPNIMILGYLHASDAADPALVQRTQGTIERGYKLLTGYETPEKGYEWFGHTPGHEALTAYGLMEFADMAKVYDVDRTMVERTASWLMSRRDHQGGFQRSAQALDSFGRASPTTTNAYIMWALAEAHRTAGLDPELAAQTQLGATTRDPYLLALASNTSLATAPRAPATAAMVEKLAALQAKDGSFPGAHETITMSGGESLTIEASALAVLALIKASPSHEHESAIRAGVDWLNRKRGGHGAWGNTQATILGLKVLTAYASYARQTAAPGRATLVVDGVDAGAIAFDKGRRDALVWDLTRALSASPTTHHTIEVRLDSQLALPYAIAIEYRSAQPQSSPRSKLALTTRLVAASSSVGTTDSAGRSGRVAMGSGITLRAHVENTSPDPIPMTLARIGLPGGTVFQTWQLKELRDKGLIDFYETRPREVILYWRALPGSAKKDIDLNLLAQVPGNYEAPASSAYLYYTAEDKAWTAPVAIAIDR